MGYQHDFINMIGPVIAEEAKKRGYRFPSAIIAQACLESGYGTTVLASVHNYFGLKCGKYWTGDRYTKETQEEYEEGVLTTITDDFRAYSSLQEGVQGYFDFINYSRYSELKNATSSLDYLEKIKKAGYATASTYVERVYSLVERYDLQRYDHDEVSIEKVSVDVVAHEVIKGRWGNGDERKRRLEEAGYNYREVQDRVNAILRGEPVTTTKPEPEPIKKLLPLDEIAAEVIRGKWGNGDERKTRLEEAGYIYEVVQRRVNEIIWG